MPYPYVGCSKHSGAFLYAFHKDFVSLLDNTFLGFDIKSRCL